MLKKQTYAIFYKETASYGNEQTSREINEIHDLLEIILAFLMVSERG
jgi:hypothetical protein